MTDKAAPASWWDRPVTWKALIIYGLVTAPFVGFGRALAEWWLR